MDGAPTPSGHQTLGCARVADALEACRSGCPPMPVSEGPTVSGETRRRSGLDPASPRCGRARGRRCGEAGRGSSTCRAACPPCTRRASRRRSDRGAGRARPASAGPPTRTRAFTRFEKSPPSFARTWRTIWSRERPPPAHPAGDLPIRGRPSRRTRPRRAEQPHLAVEYRRIERLAVERRGRERDAPEIGRADPRVATDDVKLGLGRELRAEPDALRDWKVPRDVVDELRDRLVLRLGARSSPGQSAATATQRLPLVGCSTSTRSR